MEEVEVVDLDLPLGLLEAIGYSFAERCLGSRVGRCAGKQLRFPFIKPDVLVNRDLTDDHIYLVETEAGWRISGVIDFADGSGKSTVAGGLRGRLDTCLVVDADLFYPVQESARSNDDYWRYLIFLCRELMQNGKPVVLFGWVNPKQCEASEDIRYFSSVHYLALVSDKRTQEARIRGRYPKSRDEPPTEEFIGMALQATQILKDGAGKGTGVTVLDTTGMSVDDTLVETASWISARL